MLWYCPPVTVIGYYHITVYLQAGGSSALLMDLAAQEKSVHADFFNGKILDLCVFPLIDRSQF